jgi:UDP-N-acetyl-D-mannosaminuronate dehydrogenase
MIEIKTKEIVKTEYLIGMYYSLDDLKEQAESLYKTNPESEQLTVINNAIRDGSKAIENMQRSVNKSSVTEKDVLNNADCITGDCD